MSNKFYFDDDDSSASSADLSSLPYPKPLTRAAFLTPDFDPNKFLSSLHNRHQTLEDLRAELRQRSQDLNKELLDLVNSNYEEFLSFGRDLKGGDEKVQEVRVGVLSFRREVEGLKAQVQERREEVERLVEERKRVREQIAIGRGLLEVDRRVGELESRLMLVQDGTKDGDGDDLASDDDSEDEAEEQAGVGRLTRHAQQYVYITKLVEKLGPEHAFLVEMENRISRLKQTVLLDLGSALKQARAAAGEEVKPVILRVLDAYRIMGAAGEALKILKELKD